MASPAPPHLLTLPREIRNEIYRHLSHDVSLRFCGDGDTLVGPYTARLTNAPILSVLLTHSRLYQEYMDAAWCRNVCVSMDWEPAICHAREGGNLPGHTSFRIALGYVRCLTLKFDNAFAITPNLWRDTNILLDELWPYIPQCSSLRIIHSARLMDHVLSLDDLETVRLDTILTRLENLRNDFDDPNPPASPKTLKSLSLQQKAFGFLFSCEGKSVPFLDPCDILYSTRVVDTWVFTSDKVENVSLTSSEVFEEVAQYDEFNPCKRMTDSEVVEVKALAVISKMQHWEDWYDTEVSA